MKKIFHEITEIESNQRLDRWLRRSFFLLKQSYIEKLCRKGFIKVNNKKTKPSYKVKFKDIVMHPFFTEKVEEKKLKEVSLKDEERNYLEKIIIYEDKHYIIINKPPNIASQGGTKQKNRNIDDMFKKYDIDIKEKPRLIHRLDKETSGIMILGKTRQSTSLMSEQFKKKLIKKNYWALLIGNISDDEGELRYNIVKTNGKFEKMICLKPSEISAYPDTRLSITKYNVIERLQKKFTWVALEPVTGRTHQLRLHMLKIGCPILGDRKYFLKNPTEFLNNQKNIFEKNNLFLHSRSLLFKHPYLQKEMVFYAELPLHMKKIWKFFEWNENFKLKK